MEVRVTATETGDGEILHISADGLTFACASLPTGCFWIVARLDKQDNVILEFQDAYGAIGRAVNLGPGDTAHGRALGRVFGGGK